MYIPTHYRETDADVLRAFMREFPFATLISQQGTRPIATHLPMIVSDEKEEGPMKLLSHLSLANPQWKDWENQEVLVIFAEPHAYISPSHYSNPQSVPTWNYVAVHAYGRIQKLGREETQNALTAMISTFEPEYLQKWKEMPEKFVNGMLAGIVAFEIEVTELQGKRKLSQNKPTRDQQTIAEHLLESQDTVVKWIGKEMNKGNE